MPLTRINNYEWEGNFILFVNLGPKPNKLTNNYSVMTTDGIELGQIKWFSNWRKYAFYPKPETLYEETCLQDIAEFCKQETLNRKNTR